MGLVEQRQLIARISPPLDAVLAEQLVTEFVSMERRYIQRDWEPAELDGGHFCEALARILYHMDSGQLDRARSVDDSLVYVEDNNGTRTHAIQPRHDALHLARVVRTIYRFRNQRGVAHISPTYKANHMDARLVTECARWCITEALRLHGGADRDEVARMIRELLQFDVPAIGVFEGLVLVQRTDLTPDEEVLLLLHYAGERGYTRRQIGNFAQVASQRVSDALARLKSPQRREVIELPDGRYKLTDRGSMRVRNELADKLLAQ